MKTYRFPGTRYPGSAPSFRLASSRGKTVALGDFRSQSNIVLYLPNGTDEQTLLASLEAFVDRRRAYEAEQARVLAVLDAPPEQVAQVDDQLADSFPLLLADPEGATRRSYTDLLDDPPPEGAPLLFVLDRYGAPHAAFASAAPDDPDLHDKVLSWLEGIELECPE